MGLRAGWPRAQVRAPFFGARHLIENQKCNILCIYDMFVSLKVAEIELVEVSWMENEKREIRSDSRNTEGLPLSHPIS